MNSENNSLKLQCSLFSAAVWMSCGTGYYSFDLCCTHHVSWSIEIQKYDIGIHGIARRPMNHFGGFGGIHFHKAGSTTGTRDALYCVSINQSGTKSSWKACLHRNYWRQLLLEQLILRSSSQPATNIVNATTDGPIGHFWLCRYRLSWQRQIEESKSCATHRGSSWAISSPQV